MLHFRCANRLCITNFPFSSLRTFEYTNSNEWTRSRKIVNWHKGQAEKWNETNAEGQFGTTIKREHRVGHTHNWRRQPKREKRKEEKWRKSQASQPNQTKPNANLNCKSCLWCVIQMVGRTFRRLLLCADVCLCVFRTVDCARVHERASGRAKKLLFLNGSEIRFSIPF